jgi:CHRD domain
MRNRTLGVGLALLVVGALGMSTAAAKVNVDKLSATLNAKQEVPAQTVAVTGATGKFTATIVGRRLTWKLTFRGTSGPVLAAHIHLAKAGKANPAPAVPLCTPCRSGATGKVTVTNKTSALSREGLKTPIAKGILATPAEAPRAAAVRFGTRSAALLRQISRRPPRAGVSHADGCWQASRHFSGSQGRRLHGNGLGPCRSGGDERSPDGQATRGHPAASDQLSITLICPRISPA